MSDPHGDVVVSRSADLPRLVGHSGGYATPAAGWHGTDAELEETKRDSEARAATHIHTHHRYTEDGRERTLRLPP